MALDVEQPPTVRDAIGDLPDTAAPDGGTPIASIADGNDSRYRRYVTGQVSLLDYIRAVQPAAAIR
jgi:hypothetical protein